MYQGMKLKILSFKHDNTSKSIPNFSHSVLAFSKYFCKVTFTTTPSVFFVVQEYFSVAYDFAKNKKNHKCLYEKAHKTHKMGQNWMKFGARIANIATYAAQKVQLDIIPN